VSVDSTGYPSLVASLPTDEVRALLDKGAKAGPESLALLKQAANKSPNVPGVHAMVADAALTAGDLDTAESAARTALAVDPAFPHAFRILAEVALRRDDKDRAREAIARALALYPTYPRAWKVAEVIAGRPLERAAVIEQPFIEVNGQGAVVVVTCDRPFCSGYAACKAAFRFEPVFRASVLQEPDSQPYHLSATEEAVCLQAGLGTHIEARQQDPAAVSDPTAELLIQLASEKGLTAYALFEVLGTYRPEWLRVAPRPVHEAIVEHIQLRRPSPRPRRRRTHHGKRGNGNARWRVGQRAKAGVEFVVRTWRPRLPSSVPWAQRRRQKRGGLRLRPTPGTVSCWQRADRGAEPCTRWRGAWPRDRSSTRPRGT
jgi:hypothetical protein